MVVVAAIIERFRELDYEMIVERVENIRTQNRQQGTRQQSIILPQTPYIGR